MSAAPPLAPLPWLHSVLVAAGLIVLVAVVYSPVRSFGFVFLDDQIYVSHNPHVLAGLTSEGVRWAMTASTGGNWHPMTWLSHMMDVELFGPDPGAHHIVNVAIHAANAVLLFTVLIRMTRGIWLSAIVAALFAVHPLHVESVAWISERKDVLSTFFLFLSLHAYVANVRHATVARKATVVVFFALALMSKPMVITFPFLLLVLDLWPLQRINGDDIRKRSAWMPLVREKIPLLGMTAIAIVLTLRAPKEHGAVVSTGQLSLGERTANAIVSYGHYLRGIFWPSDLAAYYPFHRPAAVAVIATLLLLGVVTVYSLQLFRKFPFTTVGWLWFIGTLVPAIGLIQVGDQARADRFTYVPAIGIFIIVVWEIAELVRRFPTTRIMMCSAAASMILVCTFLSRRQVTFWHDDLSLFRHTVAATKDNYRGETLLGVALSDSGRFEEAIPHFRKSLQLVPTNAESHNNYASALDAVGRTQEAAQELSEAVRLEPSSAVFNYNLAVVNNKLGKTDEALAAIRNAVSLEPQNKEYSDALNALMRQSR